MLYSHGECKEFAILYPNNLKNWEFGKKAAQIFYLARVAVLIATAQVRDKKSEKQSTQPQPNFSSCLGIQFVVSNGQYEIREMTDVQIHAD
ncbi:MAG TPA: hypothetical protein VGJ00_02185 [Rhabdochlamydiaceae bacterium]|jgi:hypothetical protein